jgi:hypothetical protein
MYRPGVCSADASCAIGLGIPSGHAEDEVDTALVMSVDVSNSVDDHRYQLQIAGIAAALEDSAVIDAILNGPKGGILFSMIEWSDKPKVAVPWTKITAKAQAYAVAQAVRKLPRNEGEFTCMSIMMRFVADKVVTQIPAHPTRVVIDVSGDGPDNCNGQETTDSVRDQLVASSVVINGLPIIEGNSSPDQMVEAGPSARSKTEGTSSELESWYRSHVMGGTGAFVSPAYGYEDFGRAMRQKFVVEVSSLAASTFTTR